MDSEKDVQTDILLNLGKRPELRVWLHNVGRGYGLYIVQNAIKLMKKRQWANALNVLLRATVISWGIRGQSDINGIHKSGRTIWIEVKAPGKLKEEKPEQKKWGAMIRKYGGFYACVDSVEMAVDLLFKEGLIDEH